MPPQIYNYASIQANLSIVDYIPTSTPEEIVEKIKNGEHTITQGKQVKIKEVLPEDQPSTTPSIQARAQQLLATNQISFDPKLHVFNVKGTSGVTRVVTMFPKQSCSCPSTSGCYHIQAVKLSLGIQSEKPSTRNLTHLRSNTRSRRDKRSGRKRPRVKDLDSEEKGVQCHTSSTLLTSSLHILLFFLHEQQWLMLQARLPTVNLKGNTKV